MNNWLQRRIYKCPACGAEYLHDRGYRHQLFNCSARRVLATSTCAIRRHVLNLSTDARTPTE